MTRPLTIAMAVTLAVTASSASADDYHLYRADKTTSAEIPAPGDGVLTKTILIQKGDTLSRLSHRYNGRSSYFSQILLFNRIDNPDLIYAGKTLRIPLTRSEGTALPTESRRGTERKRAAAVESTRTRANRHTSTVGPVTGLSGSKLFARGVKAFVRGHYREAIDIFDSYLAKYPHSADAPEAALYRADCYMKLSGGR